MTQECATAFYVFCGLLQKRETEHEGLKHMSEAAEQAMNDADLAAGNGNDAGNDGGSATMLDELIEQGVEESGVSEQAEAAETTEGEEETETEETDTEEAGDSTTEDTEDTEEEEAEDPLSDEEKAQLKQATQERITKKINKAHAERAEAIERAEAVELERDELAERNEALQSQLDAVDVNEAAAASGVSDLFLVENEAALDARADKLQQGVDALDDWLDSHDRDEVMTLQDGAEYSYADVKARRRGLNRSLARDVPKARKVLERRAVADATARKHYPNLFKSSSAEHVEMQRLLRTVPGLRALPDAKLLVGRMLAGKGIEGKTSAPKAAAKKPKPTAPKPPKSATPAAKAGSKAQSHNPEKVMESGSWEDLVT